MSPAIDDDVISILCPTRGRQGLLAASIRMLMHLAARPNRIEVLLAADTNEQVDYESEVWSRFAPRGGERVGGRVTRMPRCGYAGLNHYYNALALEARGRWCALWNDDILMATKDWDLVLDGVHEEIAVALTESNHGRNPCTFPIFTRSYADAIGHVSQNPHNDTWIQEVGAAAGITVDVPILLIHAMLDDKTAHEGKGEGRVEQTSASYYTPQAQAMRAEDVRKIKERLR